LFFHGDNSYGLKSEGRMVLCNRVPFTQRDHLSAGVVPEVSGAEGMEEGEISSGLSDMQAVIMPTGITSALRIIRNTGDRAIMTP
jgi:hypothetical protein